MSLNNNYSMGNTVTAADINFYNIGSGNSSPNINSIWSQGSSSFGYGQINPVNLISSRSQVTANNGWGSLVQVLEKILAHQGVAYIPAQGNPIVYSKIHALTDFEPALLQAWSYRLNSATQGTAITASTTITNNWNTTASAVFSVAFDNIENARYFFNTGGTVEVNVQQTSSGGNVTFYTNSQKSAQTVQSEFIQMDFLQSDYTNGLNPLAQPQRSSWVLGSNSYSITNNYNYTVESDALVFGNFGFNIPGDATILGISLSFDKQSNQNGSLNYIADGQIQVYNPAQSKYLNWSSNSVNDNPITPWVDGTVISNSSNVGSSGVGIGLLQPLQGTIYGAKSSAGIFDVAGSDTPYFNQYFTNLTFNSHPNSIIPGFGNGGANDNPTYLSHNATDRNGYYLNDEVVTGNGHVCGNHVNTPYYNIVYRGAFIVTQPGNHTIVNWTQNGWILGIGPANNTSAHPTLIGSNHSQNTGGFFSVTPLGNYPILCSDNTVHRYNNSSSGGTPDTDIINFPVIGVYPFEFGWGGVYNPGGDIYSAAWTVDNSRAIPGSPRYAGWNVAQPVQQSYGSSTDLWGGSWTPAAINNNNFSFAVHALLYNAPSGTPSGPSSNPLVGTISNVQATVYYTVIGENPKNAGWQSVTSAAGDIVLTAAGQTANVSSVIINGRTLNGGTAQINQTANGIAQANIGFHDLLNTPLNIFTQEVATANSSSDYGTNSLTVAGEILDNVLVISTSLNDVSHDTNYQNSGDYVFNLAVIPTGDANLVSQWGNIAITSITSTL